MGFRIATHAHTPIKIVKEMHCVYSIARGPAVCVIKITKIGTLKAL